MTKTFADFEALRTRMKSLFARRRHVFAADVVSQWQIFSPKQEPSAERPAAESNDAMKIDGLTENDVTADAESVAESESASSVEPSEAIIPPRPCENGLANANPPVIGADPSKMTLDEIKDVISRAKHGEKISF